MSDSLPIFDIDTHFTEPPDLWSSRAPRKYKGRVLHVEEKENGHEAWFVGGRQVGMTGPCVVDSDMQKHLGVYTLPKYELMSRAGTFGPERLAYMDSAGIGTQLIYPNIIGFGGQALMRVTDDEELRLFHVQAYNDAIMDLQRSSGNRLLPQAALPLWDLDASLAELERTRKMGLSGVVMSHSPGDFGQPPLAHPKWAPFFSTCQDLGLPVDFHVGSGGFEGDLRKWWGDDATISYADGTLNAPLTTFAGVQVIESNSADICNLIMTGILEKYPRLKFVSVESGCGWVPFTIKCLEYHWKEMMTSKYTERFKREPREMFMDQIYCSYWFEDRPSVDAYIAEFGADNLMFETDFPHPTSLYPGTAIAKKVEETLAHHSRETQEKVLYKNAERLYGVSVHKVKSAAH